MSSSILQTRRRRYYTTNQAASSITSTSPHVQGDAVTAKTSLYHWYRYHLEDVSTIVRFVSLLLRFPKESFHTYGAFDDKLRIILAQSKCFYVDQGLSFTVRVEFNRELDPQFIAKFPEKRLSKYQAIAKKIPRQRPGANSEPDRNNLISPQYFRDVAWESHVLFHPPIQRSENIVDLLALAWEPVYDHAETVLFLPTLIMEFADEGTLDDLLRCEESLVPLELKLSLTRGIARGLQVLHGNGVVHGDLKCQNILIFHHPTETLVAKISDFGCAVHDFGVASLCQLRGHSPPWNAPEAQQRTIPAVELPKLDIYSFGLLLWRTVLHARTPFDRRSTRSDSSFRGFENIVNAPSLADKLSQISVLKNVAYDKFLECVRATTKDLEERHPKIGHILNHTLRQDPHLRCDIKELLEVHFESKTSVDSNHDVSEPVTSPADDARGTMTTRISNYFEAEAIAPGIRDRILPGSLFENMEEVDEGRLFFDLRKGSMDVLSYESRELPRAIKTYIAAEFLTNAAQRSASTSSRASSALQYAICKLSAFGCDHEAVEGLKWLEKAAIWGNIQAQALVYRVSCALDVPISASISLVKQWLETTTAEGSLIAFADLKAIDGDSASASRNIYLLSNYGKLGSRIRNSTDASLASLLAEDDDGFRKQLEADLDRSWGPGTYLPSLDASIDGVGGTLLHYAAAHGNESFVAILLDMGADVNVPSDTGETALSLACRCNHVKIIRTLLKHGASAATKNFLCATPLHYVVYLDEDSSSELARLFVVSGCDVNSCSLPFPASETNFICETFNLSGTPLHWAVQCRRLDLVQILLELGADVTLNESLGIMPLYGKMSSPNTSPMHLAAELHNLPVLNVFLEHVKKTNLAKEVIPAMTDAVKKNVFEMICLNGPSYKADFLEITRLLYTDKPKTVIMGDAIIFQQPLLVEHIVDSGYDLEAPIAPAGNPSALHLSLSKPDGDISLYLLNQGATPYDRRPSRPSCTLSALALRPDGSRWYELSKRLLEGGNSYAEEPAATELLYRRAVVEGWTEVADLVIANGLPRTPADQELLRDILAQNSEASLIGLSYLIKHFTESFSREPILASKTRSTALHLHVQMEEYIRDDDVNQQILTTMLAKFATAGVIEFTRTLNALQNWGATALTLAADKGNHQAVRKLLQFGARIDAGANVFPFQVIASRIIAPDTFEGDVSTISSRTKKLRRYEENTVKTLGVLLEQHEPFSQLSRIATEEHIRENFHIWQSPEFYETTIRHALEAQCSVTQVTFERKKSAKGSGNWIEIEVFDNELEHRRKLSPTEHCNAFGAVWMAILDVKVKSDLVAVSMKSLSL